MPRAVALLGKKNAVREVVVVSVKFGYFLLSRLRCYGHEEKESFENNNRLSTGKK